MRQGTAEDNMPNKLWLMFRIILLPPATTLRGGRYIMVSILVRL